MTTLQSAVSAVTGVTWRGASAPIAPAVGDAWDDGQLRVVLAVADPAENLATKALAASLITAALAAVPAYSSATASSDVWRFPGRRATVGTWTKPAQVGGSGSTVVLRSQTAAQWAADSTVLAANELAIVSDAKDLLVGDATTPGSTLARVGSGTYAGLGGPLTRWRQKLASSPTTAKIVVLGDSTANEPSGAGQFYSALRQYTTNLGEPLYGLTSDVFTDGVTTNTSPTLGSATAAFTTADIGRAPLISTTKVPATATIIAVATDGLSCTLSQNATANGTSVKFQVGRRIVGLGYSGLTLGGWLTDTAKQAELVAQNPDLIIASWGLNDMRIGLTDLATMTTRLQALIAFVAANLPGADLLLRIPNAMLSQNVGSLGYVTAADGTVNPTGAAQSYSKDLRSAYLAVKARGYAHVDVIDTQAEVTGTISRFSHPDMADQLHPSVSGDQSNPTSGGYAAIARWVAGYIGRTPWGGGWKNDTLRGYGTTQEFRISGGGSGFVDLTSLGSVSIDPAHWPIEKNWSLIVPGIDAVLALTATTITRPISGGLGARIQSLPSPANATDFSAATWLNQVVLLVNPAAGREPTTNDRQVVAIDLPSIAAGATVTQTVTVTGAISGSSGSAAGISQANAVVVTPPSTFSASGLLLFAAYPTAADTVTLIINNPTGGAIDRSSESWAFWVVR